MNKIKYFLFASVLFCAVAACSAELVFETTFRQDEKGNILDNVNKDFKGKLHKGSSITDAPFGKALKVERILDNGAFFTKNPALSMDKDYTVSMWINAASFPGKKEKRGFGSMTILQWGSLRLAVDKGGVNMQTFAGEKRNILFKTNTPANVFGTDQWVHIAFTWKVGDAIRLYVNGEKKGERKNSIKTKTSPAMATPPASPFTDSFLIGSLRNFFPFHGQIAKVRFYKGALTEKEIMQEEKEYAKKILQDMKKDLAKIDGSNALLQRIGAELKKDIPFLPVLTAIGAEKSRLVKFSDFKKKVKTAGDGSLAYSIVDPMGPVIYYRDTALPEEGLNGKLLVVAAQNEYEPASFIVKPLKDIKDFLPVMGDLVSKEGNKIPAKALDILLVKQIISANRMLHPNVLIHDDKMLKVDVEKMQMSVRCTYPDKIVYKNVTPEKFVQEVGNTVDKYPIYDSKTLLALDLKAGVNQQYWITLKTDEKMAPGLYESKITLKSGSKTVATIPVKVRILPFALPEPATNYDIHKEFSVATYFFDHIQSGTKDVKNGALNHTRPLTKEQLKAYLINLREHGVKHPTIIMGNYFPGWNTWKSKSRKVGPRTTNGDKQQMEWMKERIKILKECGFALDPIYLHTGGNIGFREFYKRSEHKKYLESFIKEGNKFYKELLGHDNIYHYGLDEAEGERLLAEYDVWEDMRKMGAKIYTTIKKANTPLVAGRIDVAIAVHQPEKATAKLMHDKGGRMWAYAQPWARHYSGYPQRKGYGYDLYFADYDGVCNYSYNHWNWQSLPWNMYNTAAPNLSYVMPKADGVVDTPGWEGHREGTDDVRYATKLRQEILKAKKGSDKVKKAKALKAERFLDTVNTFAQEFDPAWTRYHIIDHILNLIEK
ncbi:MAG: LamG domain-containing protein [Lentisphaeria bacterium]|nr:LamG domain-containing protein [Lentisphaeria bacterium]